MSNAETSTSSGPVGSEPGANAAYRVLARKYRPATFEDLIGQDAMVRTLSNAFAAGRIPQAWILTGVRGVGKTTTARILARALNYQRPGDSGGPTIAMPELGIHCQAIMESRHVDVLEMDAASHNGVDDIRQINEAVRYAPVTARYKVYILDEVHMLSAAAFNALLKTLEEPPPHAKFIFATTEVRKVPVTVLSRCQRFDLRRVEAAVLARHLNAIAAKEDIAVEADALFLITRAAEGSVRDALSLLDQAIAHAGAEGATTATRVRAETIRQMLGLADRARIIDVFEAVMRGDIALALTEFRELYDCGADPVVVLADVADFAHFVTRVKIIPTVADDQMLPEMERVRGRACAAALSMRVLSHTWQMLLRGIAEVQAAATPLAAAEMVLVRIAYAADLPAPEEVIRSLAATSSAPVTGPVSARASLPEPRARRPQTPRPAGPAALASPQPMPASPVADLAEPTAVRMVGFEDLIALATERRDLPIRAALERDVRVVHFEDGRLEISLEPGALPTLVNELSRKFAEWTGRRWMVIVSAEPGAPTVRARRAAEKSDLMRGVRSDPLVEAVLARFPGAEILDVRRRHQEAGPPFEPAFGEAASEVPEHGFGGSVPNDVDDDLS
jgi:DNA polymerase-3 subunit gamma/tau